MFTETLVQPAVVPLQVRGTDGSDIPHSGSFFWGVIIEVKAVGSEVGTEVGSPVGIEVGSPVGIEVGSPVGTEVGSPVGVAADDVTIADTIIMIESFIRSDWRCILNRDFWMCLRKKWDVL
jgi:hypothetical protein